MICKLRSIIRHLHSMDTQVESMSWMKDIQDIGQSIRTPNLILGTLIGHIYIKNSKLSISANNLNSYSPIKFHQLIIHLVWHRDTLELRSAVDSPTPWKSLCKQFVFSRSCLDRNVSWAHNLLQDAKSLSIKRDNINTHLSHRVMCTPLKAAALCCFRISVWLSALPLHPNPPCGSDSAASALLRPTSLKIAADINTYPLRHHIQQ